MHLNYIVWLMLALGLGKAIFFVGFVRWCIKNDQNIDPGSVEGNDDTDKPNPDNPYLPAWQRIFWRRRQPKALPLR